MLVSPWETGFIHLQKEWAAIWLYSYEGEETNQVFSTPLIDTGKFRYWNLTQLGWEYWLVAQLEADQEKLLEGRESGIGGGKSSQIRKWESVTLLEANSLIRPSCQRVEQLVYNVPVSSLCGVDRWLPVWYFILCMRLNSPSINQWGTKHLICVLHTNRVKLLLTFLVNE